MLKKSSDQRKNCTFAAFQANSRSETRNCCVFAGLTIVQEQAPGLQTIGRPPAPFEPLIQKTPPQPVSAAEAQGAVPLCIDSDEAPGSPLPGSGCANGYRYPSSLSRNADNPPPPTRASARSRTELPGATRQPRTGTTCSLARPRLSCLRRPARSFSLCGSVSLTLSRSTPLLDDSNCYRQS